jgi:hypothetical protein
MQVTIDQNPLYRVITGRSFYDCASSTYVGSEEEFEWDGEPSEDLEPLNEAAQENMQRFFDRVDALPRRKNPSAQATDVADALSKVLEQFAARNAPPAAPIAKIESAAATLGIDPADLLKALGLDAPQRVPAPYENEEFEVQPARKATIAQSEPEDRPLTTVKTRKFRNKLEMREPKPRGRPKKISLSAAVIP